MGKKVNRGTVPAAHAGGALGEVDLAFDLGQKGYDIIIGPAGGKGHRLTEGGFDTIAYKPDIDELIIADNKAVGKPGNYGKFEDATAITSNLGKNVKASIEKIKALESFPNRAKVIAKLEQLEQSLKKLGQKGFALPKGVRVVLSNAGGYAKGLTPKAAAELSKYGIEFYKVTDDATIAARKNEAVRGVSQGRITPSQRASATDAKAKTPAAKVPEKAKPSPGKPPAATTKKTPAQKKAQQSADAILTRIGKVADTKLDPGALEQLERKPSIEPQAAVDVKQKPGLHGSVETGRPTAEQRKVSRPGVDVAPRAKVSKQPSKPVVAPTVKPTGKTAIPDPQVKPPAKPQVVAPTPRPPVKPVKAPKFRIKINPKLKGGAFIALEIAFDLLLGWLDSKRISEKIERLMENNKDKFEQVLTEDKVQKDLIKFRTGENLENGYQLYFFIQLFVTRTCSDGGCGTSGSISDIYFMRVSFSRTKGKDYLPDPQSDDGWGEQYDGKWGETARLYSPVFNKGESIKTATEDAADENLKTFDEYFIKRKHKSLGDYQRDYFDAFRQYAVLFWHSKASQIYELMQIDNIYALNMVDLGRWEPGTLFNAPYNMKFEEILRAVRWGFSSRVLFILNFYNYVLTMNDHSQVDYLDLYDIYFRELDDSYTKCQTSCHRGTGNKRIINRITAIDVKMKHRFENDPAFKITEEEQEEYDERRLEEFASELRKP